MKESREGGNGGHKPSAGLFIKIFSNHKGEPKYKNICTKL